MNRLLEPLADLGHVVLSALARLGLVGRFFLGILAVLWLPIRRFSLLVREVYFSGFRSLLIVTVSGLFVGMVLAVQGYEVLQRFGSAESLGVLVALSLVRAHGGHRANRRHGYDGCESDGQNYCSALSGCSCVRAYFGLFIHQRRYFWQLLGGCAVDRD